MAYHLEGPYPQKPPKMGFE